MSNEQEISDARQLMWLVARSVGGRRRARSHEQYRTAMGRALTLAIEGHFWFALEDFAWMAKPHYEGGLGWPAGEGHYAQACATNRMGHRLARHGPNVPACRAYEQWRKRKPFILKEPWRNSGRRLAVGSQFKWQGQDVHVTSFAKDGKSIIACAYKGWEDGARHFSYKVTRRFRVSWKDLRAHNRRRRAEERDE